MRHEANFSNSTPTQLTLFEIVPSVNPNKRPRKGKPKSDPNVRFDGYLVHKPCGCIEYGGAKDSGTMGYGRFYDGNRMVRAHKFAWERKNGPVPHGMILRHVVCNNYACTNPDHMAIGFDADNIADMIAAGRQKLPLKTHQVAELMELREAGFTEADLAEYFDRSALSIRRILKGATHSRTTGIEYKPTRKGPDWKAIRLARAEKEAATCSIH